MGMVHSGFTQMCHLLYSVLLNYLAQKWDKVGSKIDKKLFQSTLRSFSITNEELAAQGRNSSEGYQDCVAACKVRQSDCFVMQKQKCN
jgi:hypothetical protein